MDICDSLDHIVLFSGDGDFRRLVDAVQRRGRRVTVVSTLRSQPPMIADELRRQADVFVELTTLMPEIARSPNNRPQQQPQETVEMADDDYEDDDYDVEELHNA